MKLGNLGIKFFVDGVECSEPSPSKPTKLVFNGRPSYRMRCGPWGFFLEPEEDMVAHMITSKSNSSFQRRDLMTIAVDYPGFNKTAADAKMRAIKNALIARISPSQSAFICAAIDWWLDQALEKDSQSP